MNCKNSLARGSVKVLRPTTQVKAVITLSTLVAVSAIAQERADVEKWRGVALEEVVVTAQKRDQDIKDVGLTIAVVGQDDLRNQRITSLADVAGVVPGLTFAPSTSNTPIFTMRGVGFNESALAVYPTVSVYLDQAPLPFPVLALHTAYDIEHIEVLKGPQGILFGQNSTGGAINYIAAKPTDSFAAGVDLTYGRFSQIEGNAFVSGPIANGLKGRLAVTANRTDAWQRSLTRGDELGELDYFAGRMTLEWDPSENTSIVLGLNAWKDQSDPQAFQLTAVVPQVPDFVEPEVLNAAFPTDDSRDAEWTPDSNDGGRRPRSDREFFQGTLRADIGLSDAATLTSITSFVTFDQRQSTDGDGVAPSTYDLRSDAGDIESFSQELRLANAGDSSLYWLVGVNYEKSSVKQDADLFYRNNSTSNPVNNFIESSGILTDDEMENYAVFANVEYELSDRFTLKAGARYTESKRDNLACGYDTGDDHINVLFTFLGNLLSGTVVPPLGSGDCYTMNYQFIPGDPYVDTLKEDNVSWRVGLDFKPTDDALLYANIAKGYKAGSYPNVAASTYLQNEPVTQESVLAYEAGVKLQALDRMLSLDAAAFYYDYQDKQIRGKVLDPLFGILDILRNVPESEIWGMEADVIGRPITGLELRLTTTYIKSEIKESPSNSINIFGAPDNFDGDPIPFTPEWQAAFKVTYEWELSTVVPFVGLTVAYSSEAEATPGAARMRVPDSPFNRAAPGHERPYMIDEYTTIGLHAGIKSANDKWRVMVWGKNVTDEYYWTNIVPGSDTISRFAGMPATYGLTIGYEF